MKAIKGNNAQATLSKRQQEQQAKIKKIGVAILIAVLIFIALLMLESNLISDEKYTYVVTAVKDIDQGTMVNEQNYSELFTATAISQRQHDEYVKITMDDAIPNFDTAEEAMDQIRSIIQSSSYTAKNLSKLQYVNAKRDLTTFAQYIQSSKTTNYYANNSGEQASYHKVQVIDPVDIAFGGSDAIRSQAGEIREGDIVEIGFTQSNVLGETEYVNGWSKDYNEPVLITRKYVTDIALRQGYYTVYQFGVREASSSDITDAQGNVIKTIEAKKLQKATIYVQDADETGAVLMEVVEPREIDAAGVAQVLSYETYFNNLQPGMYILTKNGWEPYNYLVNYDDIEIHPAEYNVNQHFMDLSAVHFQAVLTTPGETIGQDIEDASTLIPQVYKAIISKADIQYFYKFINSGNLVMTKIMNVDEDPHLVQPDYSASNSSKESIYVKINNVNIIRSNEDIVEQIEQIIEEVEQSDAIQQPEQQAGQTLDSEISKAEQQQQTPEQTQEQTQEQIQEQTQGQTQEQEG